MTRKDEVLQQLKRMNAWLTVVPFILLFFYITTFAIIIFMDVRTGLLDLVVYVSPLVSLFNTIGSFVAKLCVWHKVSCLLPILPFLTVIWHKFISPLNGHFNHYCNIFVFIMFLISAYFVFIKNGRTRQTNDSSLRKSHQGYN